jgi:dihydroxy-acid dehydratase
MDDVAEVFQRTPLIASLQPGGKYLARDLHHAGGVARVLKALLEGGYLHGDTLTLSGETLAASLAQSAGADGEIIRPTSNPLHPSGGVVVLKGSLCPDGALIKIAGLKALVFEGRARVFDGEEACVDVVKRRAYAEGDVLIIRNEGPKGGPGMREMLGPTSAVMGLGLGKDVALITDGRFSGGSHGFVVGHITPEAFTGGPLAIVKNGDPISIDALTRKLTLGIPDSEIAARLAKWKQPKPLPPRWLHGQVGMGEQVPHVFDGRQPPEKFHALPEPKLPAERFE